MKILKILFCINLIAITPTIAQNYYEFSEHTGNYELLKPANKVTAHHFNGDTLTELPVQGETFTLFDEQFSFDTKTAMRIQTFGNLRIDKDTTIVIFDGVFTSLSKIDSSTAIHYRIDGGLNNKVVKVEWRNVSITGGPLGNYCNFQIWVYQKYGVIELRYGDRSENNASGYNSSNGPYAGIFKSNNSFNNMHEKLWLFDNPENISVDSSETFVFNRLRGLPSNGTIWRFTPKKYKDSISIGIPEFNSVTIKTFPNPATKYLNVEMTGEITEFDYTIYNSFGQKVLAGRIKDEEPTINISALNSGIYYLSIENSNRSNFTSFIKN